MLRNLLRPDSGLMITMTQLTDTIFLSLFWILGCLPVVTIGASCAALYDAAYRGERNGYDLIHWAKSMNVSSLRLRLYYHGKEIVLGGDAYAHMWETATATPCDILKVPHHASLSSTTRKLLKMLQPKTAVVCVAARRPDERPHPYIVGLLKECVDDVRFTDAVEIPGLVEPEFHESVHIEFE